MNTLILEVILDAAHGSMQAIPLNGTSVPLTLVNAARAAVSILKDESFSTPEQLVETLRECAEIARRKKCTVLSVLIDDAADGILEELEMMLTRVVIQEGGRQFRFVTTASGGRAFRQLATIVQDVILEEGVDDFTLRVAKVAFISFPHYPIEFSRTYDLTEIDWTICVDCANHRIQIGKVNNKNRDAYINFGEDAGKIRGEEF